MCILWKKFPDDYGRGCRLAMHVIKAHASGSRIRIGKTNPLRGKWDSDNTSADDVEEDTAAADSHIEERDGKEPSDAEDVDDVEAELPTHEINNDDRYDGYDVGYAAGRACSDEEMMDLDDDNTTERRAHDGNDERTTSSSEDSNTSKDYTSSDDDSDTLDDCKIICSKFRYLSLFTTIYHYLCLFIAAVVLILCRYR